MELTGGYQGFDPKLILLAIQSALVDCFIMWLKQCRKPPHV